MKDPDCTFCRIIAGQAPAKIIYRDERAIAFYDRSPRAPVHVLIVPVEHIDSLNDLTPGYESLAGHLLFVARQIAEQEGIAPGYRLIINTGRGAGQIVFHLHLHLLGGGGPMRL